MAETGTSRTETRVREYKGGKAYSKDAAALAREGWQPVNTVERHPRAGCLRILLLAGVGALVFKPKPLLVVTYQRETP